MIKMRVGNALGVAAGDYVIYVAGWRAPMDPDFVTAANAAVVVKVFGWIPGDRTVQKPPLFLAEDGTMLNPYAINRGTGCQPNTLSWPVKHHSFSEGLHTVIGSCRYAWECGHSCIFHDNIHPAT